MLILPANGSNSFWINYLSQRGVNDGCLVKIGKPSSVNYFDWLNLRLKSKIFKPFISVIFLSFLQRDNPIASSSQSAVKYKDNLNFSPNVSSFYTFAIGYYVKVVVVAIVFEDVSYYCASMIGS